MASTRRMGVESSETRAQLIDAAEKIIHEEGCGALTARRLAERVNLKRQIVHYYFGTIEDLLLAVIRRSADRTRVRLHEALESDDPLRVMWREGHYTTAMSLEFLAIAARHEGARAAIKGHIEEFRGLLSQALTRELERRGVKPAIPPAVVTIVLMSISESLAVESAMGVSDTHEETRTLTNEWIRGYLERGEWLDSGSKQKSFKHTTGRVRRARGVKKAARSR